MREDRKWWFCRGIHVNGGRPPTRLGGDGIAPYVEIPDWLFERVVQLLEDNGIVHEAKPAGHVELPWGPAKVYRIDFPGGDAPRLEEFFGKVREWLND